MTGPRLLRAWVVAPTTRDGRTFLTPQCAAGHPYLPYKDAAYTANWRGDMWMVLRCRECRPHAAFLVYFSTGSEPAIHHVELSPVEAQGLEALHADATVLEALAALGYVRSYTPPPRARGRQRWLEQDRARQQSTPSHPRGS